MKRVPESESFGRQNADREQLQRETRDNSRIDGSQFVRLYEKMQALVAGLTTTVTNLVNSIVPTVTYTRAQTDAKVASPGAISPTSVSASGDVTAAGRVRSPGSRSYVVSTGYAGLWVEADGTFGIAPSTRRLKKNLTPMWEPNAAGIDAIAALLALEPQWGHYVWDDDGEPLKSFLIAEDVHAAGFGPDVAPTENGEPFTLNYSQMVPALIATVQRLHAQREADRALIAALYAHLNLPMEGTP